ncbi:hypothetical protein WAE59_06370 [Pedobacter sp. GR22-6]
MMLPFSLPRFSAAFCLCILAVLVLSCKKKVPAPEQEPVVGAKHVDLSGQFLERDRDLILDLNADGRADLLMKVLPIAFDLNTKTKLTFQVYATGVSRVAVNVTDESSPALRKGDQVFFGSFSGYEWFPANPVIIMEKVSSAEAITWQGAFLSEEHRFLPLQLLQEGKLYTAWLELSTDKPGEKVHLHRAGIALEPGSTIICGQ